MIHHGLAFYYEYRKQAGKRGFPLLRKVGHDILSEIVGGTFELLCKAHVFRPCVVVMMDGGICSQMNQYLLGQIYAERGEKVCYDLTWYEKNGMDVDGRFVRTFELEEMFPGIRVMSLGKMKTWFYRTFLMYVSVSKKQPKKYGTISPVYLGGYYSMDDEAFSAQFEKSFINAGHADSSNVLCPTTYGRFTCAVHVRRGDLARGDNPSYGGVSDGYFFRAIECVERLHPKTLFFFFSDEIEFVKTNIVPCLSVDYVLMNEQHKAFEDLLSISKCDMIIASQGSFGKFAAMLNKNSTLVLCDNKYSKSWVARKKDVILI